MPTPTFRRCNATFVIPPIPAARPKQPKFIKREPRKWQTVSPEELEKQRLRRIEKAERDERMDIGFCLTPVKTYMGGFTRPRDLRMTNWLPGGRFLAKSKLYEDPAHIAYQPHIAFLIRSRYLVHFGPGRPNAPEFIVGYCPVGRFKHLLRRLNSGFCESKVLEAMDNACWPGLARELPFKPIKWWNPGEDPDEIRVTLESGRELPQSAVSTEGSTSSGSSSEGDAAASDGESSQEKDTLDKVAADTESVPLTNEVTATVESSSTSPSTTQPADNNLDEAEKNKYDSDDDDLAVDLAIVEGAKRARRAKAKEMMKQGVSPHSVLAFMRTPFVEEQVLASFKKPESRPQLMKEQILYLADKAKLRAYTNMISSEVFPNMAGHGTSVNDPNLMDPKFVETNLAGTVYDVRRQYIPTLAKQPFWIPVLAVSLPTRPLARVMARLAKALPRGLPYYASMPTEDLKCKLSYPSRSLNLRLTRMRRLTSQIAERLAGYYAGFPGIRFDPRLPGRGVNGTLLHKPLPEENRRITVLIDSAYERADTEMAQYLSDTRGQIRVGLMDELGNALDPALDFTEDNNVSINEDEGGLRDDEEDHASDEENAR